MYIYVPIWYHNLMSLVILHTIWGSQHRFKPELVGFYNFLIRYHFLHISNFCFFCGTWHLLRQNPDENILGYLVHFLTDLGQDLKNQFTTF